MASVTQLSLYNGALRLCKQSKLASLTETLEGRFLLDDVWADNALLACLEAGQWYFATRLSKFDYDPEQATNFGYQYVFEKPTDWIRTTGAYQDDHQNVPLTQIRDEAGFWYCDLQTIYMAYVSSDPLYGMNMGNWPPSFILFVEAYLMKQVAPKLVKETAYLEFLVGKDGESGLYLKRMKQARSLAAMAESTVFAPPGTWTRARWGRGSSRDRGNTSSLIG